VAEHATVVRVTHFQPSAGKRDELTSLLEGYAETVRGMDGCFGIQVCAVRETPEELAVISRWASEGALDQLTQFVSSKMPEVDALVASRPRTENLVSL
jgi:quinol monooxygenase YgiN